MTNPVTPEEARKDAAGLRAGGDPWPAEIIDSLAAQLEAAQKAIAQLEADVEHRDEIIQRFLAAAGERYFAEVELMKLVKDANDGTWDLVSRLAARLPVSVLHSLRETLETSRRHRLAGGVRRFVTQSRARAKEGVCMTDPVVGQSSEAGGLEDRPNWTAENWKMLAEDLDAALDASNSRAKKAERQLRNYLDVTYTEEGTELVLADLRRTKARIRELEAAIAGGIERATTDYRGAVTMPGHVWARIAALSQATKREGEE